MLVRSHDYSTNMAATTMERAREESEKTYKYIEIIQKFPAIWDIKCKEYKDKEEKRKATEAVALEMDWSVPQVTEKYKNLRTYYIKEKRKIACSAKSGAGTADLYKSKWEFFDALDEFMKDSLKIRPGSSNLTECLPRDSDEEETVNGSVQDETLAATPRRKRHKKEDDVLSAVLDVLKEPIRQEEEAKPVSTDALFGQLIGRQLEKMPEGRKKEFLKLRIQQLFVEMQFEEDTPQQSYSGIPSIPIRPFPSHTNHYRAQHAAAFQRIDTPPHPYSPSTSCDSYSPTPQQ